MNLIIGVSLVEKTWIYVWLNKGSYNKYEPNAVCYFTWLYTVVGVYEQTSRINCSIWMDASKRSRYGV